MTGIHRTFTQLRFSREIEKEGERDVQLDRIEVGRFLPSSVMAARLSAIGIRVCEENEYESCRKLSGSGEAEEAIGSSAARVFNTTCSARHRSHVDNATAAGISRLLKQSRRKQSARIRKCMCLPSNYALVEFPVVWSELRSVIMRYRN